ncbi:MAG: hypothetical protein GWN58_01950 [Anaerolineae bacterium]|nr:hypothetical protein [Anaerolineae bacterium]
MTEEETGKIQVTVQTAQRLRAITELAQAVNVLAQALNMAPQVYITRCHIESGDGVGISIDCADEVHETMIKEMPAASGGNGGGEEEDKR